MRKLATIREIDAIRPIENADAIEVADVGGWSVVVKKGEYKPGDVAVYLEIDSFVPQELAPFLVKGAPREYNGVKGERLKTVKLRGQLSQGLLLPLYGYEPTAPARDAFHRTRIADDDFFDVTEILGIQKYEPPVGASLAGCARGNFPSFIPKTDAERCQNLKRELEKSIAAEEAFEVTYKLDGSSFTAYCFRSSEDEVYTGVCSRNIDLKIDESNAENTFVKTFFKYDLDRKLREYHERTGRFIAVQGEMIGPGIQKNFEGMNSIELRVFRVYDIREGRMLCPEEARSLVDMLGLEHVPVFKERHVLKESVQELLEMADGPSGLNGKYREGLVFKSLTRDFSFKAISNRYLLKSEE